MNGSISELTDNYTSQSENPFLDLIKQGFQNIPSPLKELSESYLYNPQSQRLFPQSLVYPENRELTPENLMSFAGLTGGISTPTKTLVSLAQKAKKYKSAEEFVKANNENPQFVFRGVKTKSGLAGVTGENWVTTDFNTAKRYAFKGGKVYVAPFDNSIKGGYVIEGGTRQFQGKVEKPFLKNFYDKPIGNLTDFYNQAIKGVK